MSDPRPRVLSAVRPHDAIDDLIIARPRRTVPTLTRGEWSRRVLERSDNRCGNCGTTDRLSVHMVVPEEAGGLLVESNGYVLCRGCEMAAEGATSRTPSDRRPINFWASRQFANTLTALTAEGQRFRSMGALIRFLMALYVRDDARFDDLANYQDRGTDAKINAWVDRATYDTFKTLVDGRDLTVTDALKALVLVYASENPIEPSPDKKDADV